MMDAAAGLRRPFASLRNDLGARPLRRHRGLFDVKGPQPVGMVVAGHGGLFRWSQVVRITNATGRYFRWKLLWIMEP